MARVVGLDIGARRVGVAVSDNKGAMALPYAVLELSGGLDDIKALAAGVREVVDDIGAGAVVVGLPLSMDGSEGPAAKGIKAVVSSLEEELGLPVHLIDERLSTVQASRALRERGISGASHKARLDSMAAAILLQAWLDGGCTR